jgi:AraC family transcriptional regulator
VIQEVDLKRLVSCAPICRGWAAPHELHGRAIPAVASYKLGWTAIQAARYLHVPACDVVIPPCSHHQVILSHRPPDKAYVRFDDVRMHRPPAAGSMVVVPAGVAMQLRSSGCKDSFHVYLEPRLVGQVAADAFGIDPARLTVPALPGFQSTDLRSAIDAVHRELMTNTGGAIAAESLARTVAVQLIRQVRRQSASLPSVKPSGSLPQSKLRTVIDFVAENLDRNIGLEEMASVVHLSPFHFSRQFKSAIGLAPHQFVINRRVERARHLLQRQPELSLAEIALSAGFCDQSQFSHHFKRLVGLTPGQFRFTAKST